MDEIPAQCDANVSKALESRKIHRLSIRKNTDHATDSLKTKTLPHPTRSSQARLCWIIVGCDEHFSERDAIAGWRIARDTGSGAQSKASVIG